MAVIPSPQVGYAGRIVVGLHVADQVTLTAMRYSVHAIANELDVTGFPYFGTGRYLRNVRDYEIAFDAFWDPLDDPFSVGVNLLPGAETAISLFMNKHVLAGTQSWFFPKVLILGVNQEQTARGMITYSVTAKASNATSFDKSELRVPSLD